jgi:hypothetical protein
MSKTVTIRVPKLHVGQKSVLGEACRFNVLRCGRRWGKALALDTEMPTPSGWTTMGDIRIGDALFDENGRVCHVQAVTEVMYDHECYRMRFTAGAEVVADAGHLWVTSDKKVRRSGRDRRLKRYPLIRTTAEIADTLESSERGDINHSVQTTMPLCLPKADLPIPPYTFGAWLGDGSSYSGMLYSADEGVIQSVRNDGTPISKVKGKYAYSMSHGYVGGSAESRSGCLASKLRKLGVLNNKHIPMIYQRASIEQRMALLHGLLDTDGTVGKNGQIEFVSVRQQLAEDLRDLAAGLGYKPSMREGRAMLDGRDCGPKWRVRWITDDKNVIRLARKRDRIRTTRFSKTHTQRFIIACDKIESVPVRCLMVDSPSSLFLITRNCIPTHNSLMALQLALDTILKGRPVGWFAPIYKILNPSWELAKKQFEPLISHISEKNMSIDFRTGSKMEFWSEEDKDAGRSRRYALVIVDEAAMIGHLKYAWEQAIRPTLTDYMGYAWFFSTPKPVAAECPGGMYFDELFKRGQASQAAGKGKRSWMSWERRTSENPFMAQSEIDEARRDLPEAVFNQEYLGIPMSDGTVGFFSAIAARMRAMRETDCRPADLKGELEFVVDAQSEGSTYAMSTPKWIDGHTLQRLRLWLKLDGNRPDSGSYAGFCDLSAGVGASNSTLGIVNVDTRTQVAAFTTPDLTPDNFARYAVAICRWFGGDVLLGWEANGPGQVFGREVMRLGYYYVLGNRDLKQWRDGTGDRIGWWSDKNSKASLLSDLRRAWALGEYIPREVETLNEAEGYVYYPTMSIGPAAMTEEAEGARSVHGDRVIRDGGLVLMLRNAPRTQESEKPLEDYSYALLRQEYEQRERDRDSEMDW